MFKSEEIVYIQFQKTGCTHIASLLMKLFEGELTAKHCPATPELLSTDRLFISSIRNPWDWYLSLWTFGCQGNGGLMKRLTRRVDTPEAARALLGAEGKNVEKWRRVYETASDVNLFREWLTMIHASCNSQYLGEGYGDTAITELCGLMTYRYIYLCCRDPLRLRNPRLVTSHEELVNFDRMSCYIDCFVRQEALEDSLCDAIEKVRLLTEVDRDLIYSAKKSNKSERPFLIQEYYNKKLIDLVSKRDRLIIDKFNYRAPQTCG